VANSVPLHLPVHIVQCVENWWVWGDTLLAMPTQSLKSMNGLLMYTELATLCLLGCDTVGWYLVLCYQITQSHMPKISSVHSECHIRCGIFVEVRLEVLGQSCCSEMKIVCMNISIWRC
jgi:hypothetical protein